jgi:hypothetical protein
MKEELVKLIEEKSPGAKPLYLVIRGWPNAEELIAIRKGEVDLQTLIDNVEKEIIEVDKLFDNSELPDSIDNEFINNLIVKIRKQIYKLWYLITY